MSERHEHEIDTLSEMVIRKAGLETPPKRLKSNIMHAIYAESTYRPVKELLTQRSKITIAASIVGFCTTMAFLSLTKEIGGISGMLVELTGYIDYISTFIPKTFLYGALAFGVMVSFHVAYLKKHLKGY